MATTHREASDADAESFSTGKEDYSEVVKAIKDTPPSHSLSTMVVPIDLRKLKDILTVDYVDKASL